LKHYFDTFSCTQTEKKTHNIVKSIHSDIHRSAQNLKSTDRDEAFRMKLKTIIQESQYYLVTNHRKTYYPKYVRLRLVKETKSSYDATGS